MKMIRSHNFYRIDVFFFFQQFTKIGIGGNLVILGTTFPGIVPLDDFLELVETTTNTLPTFVKPRIPQKFTSTISGTVF